MPRNSNDRLKNFDFDMTASRFSGVLYPDEGIKQFFGSEQAKQPGSYNLAGVADPAVDTLLNKIRNRRGLGQLRHRRAGPRSGTSRQALLGSPLEQGEPTGSPTGTCSRGRRK